MLLKTERNFKIIAACFVITLAVGFSLSFFGQRLNRFEWAIIWGAIGLMFVSEALNTALEKTIDTLHPSQHPGVGQAKDMAAAATMVASITALVIGAYILLPKIIAIF